MKRVVLAAALVALSVNVFADDDEDRVLEEARRRASKNRQTEHSSPVTQESEKETVRNAREDEENDVYLPIAVSLLPGSPIPGMRVDASFGFGTVICVLDDVYGAQASTIGNVAHGDVHGVQGAGIFNVSDGGGPVQAAGIFNVADGDFFGVQGAGIFNVADGNVTGVQASSIFNVANGALSGFQISSIFNIADGDVTGVQVSGIFNVAKDLRGVQIGLVNVANTAVGLQIGLINIVREGIHDTGVWFEDSGYAYGFIQKGTAHFYTLFFVGAPREDWFETSNRLAGGAGLGFRLGGRRKWEAAIDVDLSAKGRIEVEKIRDAVENERSYTASLFPSARASIRLPIGLGLAVHAGAIVDAEVENGCTVHEEFRESDSWSASIFDTDWTFHPKLFVGFSL